MPAAEVLARSWACTGRCRRSCAGAGSGWPRHELLRIDSALLAHACLLLGDLGKYEAARAYGSAALLCAQEAGADEGLAWTAMAKTARWQDRFAEAAGLAARGFEASARTRSGQSWPTGRRTRWPCSVTPGHGMRSEGRPGLRGPRRRGHFGVVVLAGPSGDLHLVRLHPHWRPGRGAARRARRRTPTGMRAAGRSGHLGAGPGRGSHGVPAEGFPRRRGRAARPGAGAAPDPRIPTVTGYLDEISGMLQVRRFAGSAARRAARRADPGVQRGRRDRDHGA